jgi:hypothetical protein
MGSRMVHQNAPQQTGGNGKEVNSILPGYVRIHQPQISLMDQRGGTQSVVGTLGTQAN